MKLMSIYILTVVVCLTITTISFAGSDSSLDRMVVMNSFRKLDESRGITGPRNKALGFKFETPDPYEQDTETLSRNIYLYTLSICSEQSVYYYHTKIKSMSAFWGGFSEKFAAGFKIDIFDPYFTMKVNNGHSEGYSIIVEHPSFEKALYECYQSNPSLTEHFKREVAATDRENMLVGYALGYGANLFAIKFVAKGIGAIGSKLAPQKLLDILKRKFNVGPRTQKYFPLVIQGGIAGGQFTYTFLTDIETAEKRFASQKMAVCFTDTNYQMLLTRMTQLETDLKINLRSVVQASDDFEKEMARTGVKILMMDKFHLLGVLIDSQKTSSEKRVEYLDVRKKMIEDLKNNYSDVLSVEDIEFLIEV